MRHSSKTSRQVSGCLMCGPFSFSIINSPAVTRSPKISACEVLKALLHKGRSVVNTVSTSSHSLNIVHMRSTLTTCRSTRRLGCAEPPGLDEPTDEIPSSKCCATRGHTWSKRFSLLEHTLVSHSSACTRPRSSSFNISRCETGRGEAASFSSGTQP